MKLGMDFSDLYGSFTPTPDCAGCGWQFGKHKTDLPNVYWGESGKEMIVLCAKCVEARGGDPVNRMVLDGERVE